jgi:hypothetical protein
MYYCYSEHTHDLKHAIDLRQDKDKQTDFFRTLSILNDRIHVYQQMFMTNKPRVLDFKYTDGKRSSYLFIRILVQQYNNSSVLIF